MPARRVLLILLSAGALACATTPRHEFAIADGWPGATSVQRVLLAPMNATGNIAEELQPGAERTHERVKRHLIANGFTVEETPLFRFRNAWTRAFEGVVIDPKSTRHGVPAQVIANLAKRLSTHHAFDVVVMVGIEMRKTRLHGMVARWDGVSRRMIDERLSAPHWRGDPPAASLRVRAYTPGGERVFDSVGGLDMIFKYSGGNQMTVVDDPLSDTDHLDEGVRIAFDPWIPFAR